MKLVESLSSLRDLVSNSETITEAKGHLDHPEDLVFLDGSTGASRAIQAIESTAKNPKTITIKWDGYPALIFGRNQNGKFSIMDKHMFNKKDGTGRTIYSPDQFVQYDLNRGVNREQLHTLIRNIWPGLASSDKSEGYYWGDLLFSEPLQEKNNQYTFRANPNGITYTVDVDSEMGRFLTGKVAGIVVHQFIPAAAVSTDQATPLNGTIGTLKNVSDVAIVPAKMPITPKLKLNAGLLSAAKSAVSKYGDAVDSLMDNAPQARNTFNQLFTTYINKKIVSGDLGGLVNGFMQYFNTRPMSEKMREKLTQHLAANKEGVVGAFAIWIAIYKLKMDLVKQLDTAAKSSPVKGFLQDGTQTQEGFVSQGLKFVNRMGFSAQNLAGR